MVLHKLALIGSQKTIEIGHQLQWMNLHPCFIVLSCYVKGRAINTIVIPYVLKVLEIEQIYERLELRGSVDSRQFEIIRVINAQVEFVGCCENLRDR
jgi:hypothetical protein